MAVTCWTKWGQLFQAKHLHGTDFSCLSYGVSRSSSKPKMSSKRIGQVLSGLFFTSHFVWSCICKFHCVLVCCACSHLCIPGRAEGVSSACWIQSPCVCSGCHASSPTTDSTSFQHRSQHLSPKMVSENCISSPERSQIIFPFYAHGQDNILCSGRDVAVKFKNRLFLSFPFVFLLKADETNRALGEMCVKIIRKKVERK